MANGIQLNGVDNLVAELRRRGESTVKRVENKALRAAGEPMAAEMRKRAPRSALDRKYHLQDNIVVSNVRRKDGIKYVQIGPNKKVAWRAHFPEFGTSTQPAEPYIEPGYHAAKEEALQILADEVRKGLKS